MGFAVRFTGAGESEQAMLDLLIDYYRPRVGINREGQVSLERSPDNLTGRGVSGRHKKTGMC